MFRVKAVRPYAGPVEADGLVTVHDLTVEPTHHYFVQAADKFLLAHNSKRISLLDVNALMAHGAVETLRDAGAVRGQKNEQFWLNFMRGNGPTSVRVPMVYDKFFAQLKAAGVNPVVDGPRTHLMAMTDAAVDELAGDRELKNGETVNFDRDLKPIPGGLFDPKLTGGHNGRQWAHIKLHEPMPNPVMEEPVRRVLGLTGKELEAVISGEQKLGRHGTGPGAVAAALADLNLDKEIAAARAQVHSSNRGKRDEAVRRLQFLAGAKSQGLHPKDWVMSKVPVLPPAFRPVALMGQEGMPLVADPNYLYKELLAANDNLKAMAKAVGDDVGAERLAVYHAYKAVTGLGDPITQKSKDKQVKGILKSVFGTSPKFGTVQRKLISSTVDNVGRAVITPNPDFDMDTVGVPEGKAFEVYQKFVVRRLVRRGMPVTQAVRAVADKTDVAKDALRQEMEARPVYINRAPVLHKFGIMAFRPKLVTGDVLQVSPLVVKGFGADFDGDAMQFHVPTGDEAVKEAYERMMPSSNLLSPADFKSPVHMPSQEYLGGLYYSTTAKHPTRKERVFATPEDAARAFERHEITLDTPVHIVHG